MALAKATMESLAIITLLLIRSWREFMSYTDVSSNKGYSLCIQMYSFD